MSPLLNHILSVILCTPLAGAAVVFLVRGSSITVIRWVANGFAAAGFLLAVPLWFLYEPHGKTWQFAERGELIRTIGASYYVGVDGFSVLLILLATLIGWIAIVASIGIRDRVKEFYVVMLVLETGLLGVFMALDFLQFFVFWQVALLSMSLLIGLCGEGKHAALKLARYSRAGSVMMLLGILVLYVSSHAVDGVYSFDITRYHTIGIPVGVQKWVFLAWLVAFAIVVPALTLQLSTADARTDLLNAGSVMRAAVLLAMGTYGLIRFSLPILPDAARDLVPPLNGFVGGLLIVKGLYDVNTWWVATAAAGFVLGASFAWGYYRTMFRRGLTAREMAIALPLLALAIWIAVYPGPVLQRLETSIGRVVARVSPEYASLVAQGSDCPTPARPDPAGPPPGFVLVEPCADGSDAATKPPEEGRLR
jgi:NADH:ubiquinone oxidoreductase subunit 4 (subunit M)